MEIKKIEIINYIKNGFKSISNDGVVHKKILPYLSIVQSVEGNYDIALGDGKAENTGEGGFFIAPSDIQQTIVHHVNKESGVMTCRWLFVNVEVNSIYKLDTLYSFPTVINDKRKDYLNKLFDSLFETNNVWDIYSYIHKILGFLFEFSTPQKNSRNKRLEKVSAYMSDNYTKQITISELAEIANMSESNFYASFKRHFGVPPIAYLNRKRLSIAADKLIETDDTINEISYSVGFNDPFYFSKLFKKSFNLSPKEYRFALKMAQSVK